MTEPAKIRVLVVDDSILFRNVLTTRLAQDPKIEVVGYAVDAEDAQVKIKKLNPDVVTLDVEMPKMNGIELLKVLLPEYPVPVVLVSSLNISVFDALAAGAIDFVRKPDMKQKDGIEGFFKELIRKVRVAANAKVHIRPRAPITAVKAPVLNQKADSIVIAIGASTGGTEATLSVLRGLPADTPGIVIVQHMPPGFTKMYADRLDGQCKMAVKEAENGDEVIRGRVLIAPGDRQMKVVKGANGKYSVNCYAGEKVSGHCPSVDVLFDSMAKTVGAKAVGIILTGMGRDGAEGLLKMRKAGAYTIGQDRESSVVYGMPMVAYDIGGVTLQVSLEKIPDVLETQLGKMI